MSIAFSLFGFISSIIIAFKAAIITRGILLIKWFEKNFSLGSDDKNLVLNYYCQNVLSEDLIESLSVENEDTKKYVKDYIDNVFKLDSSLFDSLKSEYLNNEPLNIIPKFYTYLFIGLSLIIAFFLPWIIYIYFRNYYIHLFGQLKTGDIELAIALIVNIASTIMLLTIFQKQLTKITRKLKFISKVWVDRIGICYQGIHYKWSDFELTNDFKTNLVSLIEPAVGVKYEDRVSYHGKIDINICQKTNNKILQIKLTHPRSDELLKAIFYYSELYKKEYRTTV